MMAENKGAGPRLDRRPGPGSLLPGRHPGRGPGPGSCRAGCGTWRTAGWRPSSKATGRWWRTCWPGAVRGRPMPTWTTWKSTGSPTRGTWRIFGWFIEGVEEGNVRKSSGAPLGGRYQALRAGFFCLLCGHCHLFAGAAAQPGGLDLRGVSFFPGGGHGPGPPRAGPGGLYETGAGSTALRPGEW